MAVTTSKLYAVEDAFVTKASPLASYHNLVSVTMPYDYSDSGNTRYFIRFEEFTAAQKRKHIVALQLFLYIASVTYGTGWQHTGGGGGWDNTPATEPRKRFSAERYTDHEIDGLTYDTLHAVLGSRSSYKDMYPATLQPGAENYMGSAFEDTRWAEGVVALYPMYGNDASITFHGVLGANKPYLLISTEAAELTIRPIPATGAYLNCHAAAKLTWTLATNAYGGPAAFTQASAAVSWRNGASGTISTISVSGSEMSCPIPANTVPSTAELQWKVNVTFASGETAESDWATLTTIDSTSSCALVSPVSTFIDGSVVNRFAWDHIIATGTAQSKYDLQCSMDGGTTWIDVASAVASEAQYCDVPADTLPAGTLLWRVRTYNADGAAGTWSDSTTIVVQAAPAAPLITSVTATPRPEIAWQSRRQQAYQVTAGDYDSGLLYGTAKSFKVPVFLQDGPTDIAVRIQNSFGLWSSWARTSVTITNASPGGEIALTTASANNAVMLRWSEGAYKVYYVYRDGVPVARVLENEYVDRLAVGVHSYQVRGVEGEYYALSNTALGISVVRHAVIGAVNASDAWIPLECKRGGEPQHTIRSQATVAYHFYDGRKYPVADIAEFESVSDDLAFTLRAPEREAVMALVGKLVVYKDSYGALAIGILETASTSVRRRSDTEFVLHRVAYEEAVSYEI